MLDFKAFAVENAQREFIAPNIEALLETAIKQAEKWREAYTTAKSQGEWILARKAEAELENWTQKAATYAAMQESR